MLDYRAALERIATAAYGTVTVPGGIQGQRLVECPNCAEMQRVAKSALEGASMESKAIHFRPKGRTRKQLEDMAEWTNSDVTDVLNRATALLYREESKMYRSGSTYGILMFESTYCPRCGNLLTEETTGHSNSHGQADYQETTVSRRCSCGWWVSRTVATDSEAAVYESSREETR